MCTVNEDNKNQIKQDKSRSVGRKIALVISLTFCVLSIVLIVFLTTQNSDDSLTLSQGLYFWIAGFAIINNIDLSGSWWFTPTNIRRFAHSAEFFALGLTSNIFLNCVTENRKKAGILTLISSFCFSLADEFIKAQVPGREFDIVDMGFDFFGYLIGIIIGTVIG